MRRLALALLAGTSLLGLASVASAADLAIRKAPPPPPPPPIWSWSGFYIGAHVGGAWSTVESHWVDLGLGVIAPGVVIPIGIPLSSHNLNGFLGGVQAGFNWQIGVVVFGVEAQWSWTDQDGTSPCLIIISCSTQTDWIGTLAGRIGVTADKALLYVKGGVAWSENTYSANLSIPLLATNILDTSISDTRTGVMFGAGIEYAFTPSWSAKIEYNYIDFDVERYAFPISVLGVAVPITAGVDVDQRQHLIKAGVNYRFDLFGKGPVMARY
jgi:outer membrane immunogenic protein